MASPSRSGSVASSSSSTRLQRVAQLGDLALLLRRHDVERRELVVDVDAEARPRLALVLGRDVGGTAREVADVADRGLDDVVLAEVGRDLLGLGGDSTITRRRVGRPVAVAAGVPDAGRRPPCACRASVWVSVVGRSGRHVGPTPSSRRVRHRPVRPPRPASIHGRAALPSRRARPRVPVCHDSARRRCGRTERNRVCQGARRQHAVRPRYRGHSSAGNRSGGGPDQLYQAGRSAGCR